MDRMGRPSEGRTSLPPEGPVPLSMRSNSMLVTTSGKVAYP
jgi:hypothetical protein